eukprot:Tbor_TRINITY_DN2403_c0_g1::TRINITY_DN2403_c0_g1_i1::g.2526::m.2526/K18777/MTR3, MT57; cap3/cap4 methyltransferase
MTKRSRNTDESHHINNDIPIHDDKIIRQEIHSRDSIILHLNPFQVVHYRDDVPFPTEFCLDFPTEPYRSRFGEVKTGVHWGQRKLLLSEIQLLTHYTGQGKNTPYHIVYAGSAPGTHLGFLDDLFNNIHTWELIDPGRFDVKALGNRKNFKLRTEFFTNKTAYEIAMNRIGTSHSGLMRLYHALTIGEENRLRTETAEALNTTNDGKSEEHVLPAHLQLQQKLQEDYGKLDVARGTHDIPSMYEAPIKLPIGLKCLFDATMMITPTLFVSDIRSGSLSLDNFEDHVVENMKAQQVWTEIIGANYSMLKFRLPYTSTKKKTAPLGSSSPTTSSDVYTKSTHVTNSAKMTNTSTEGGKCSSVDTFEYLRGSILIPIWTRPTSTEGRLVVPSGAFRIPYDVQHYEDQCFYFNAQMREKFHFNHILSPHAVLDNHYDSAAEVNCLRDYVIKMYGKDVLSQSQLKMHINNTVAKITEHLGITFADAIRRRDHLIQTMAEKGKTSVNFYDEDEDESKGVPCGGFYWGVEAKQLIKAARLERSRSVWNKNVHANQLAKFSGSFNNNGSGNGLPLNCVEMPQRL